MIAGAITRRDAPLTVVVPVHNEGANIARWYAEAARWLPLQTSIRVVYDFEEDDTLPVIQELRAKGAPMTPLRNEGRGVLSAIVTGLTSAAEGPIVVSMADGSDDFSALSKMIDAYRDGADVVVASRYMPGGRQIGGPWLKGQLARWGGALCTGSPGSRPTTRRTVTDSTTPDWSVERGSRARADSRSGSRSP